MSLLLRRRGLRAWTPADVPDLFCWFRADSLEVEDGASVAAWVDVGPLGLVLSGSGVLPTYRAGAVNGHPCVRGAGSSSLTAELYFEHNGGSSSFAVMAPNAANSNRYAWVLGWGGHQSGMIIGYESGGTGGKVEHYNVPRTDLGPSTIGEFAIWEFTNDGTGGTRAGRKNGVLSESGSGSDQSWDETSMTLFGSRFGDYGFIDIAEIIVYTRGLDAEEASAVRSWLGSKYAIPVT